MMEKHDNAPDQPASDLPFALLVGSDFQQETAPALHPGDFCVLCRVGRIDYDGMLNLACPVCGPVQVGCFT